MIDVIVQSYKKPESLIYTLLSLKKYCGKHIDTIYVDDDISGEDTLKFYDDKLVQTLSPIKVKVRVNQKKSGYTHTLMTKDSFKKKKLNNKIQLLMSFLIKRTKFYSTSDDIRYQWGINNTDKKYVFIIHDDIKFNDDVLGLYINEIEKNEKLAIVGDLGGSKRCPFGPCRSKECSPEKIMEGYRPCENWPITGKDQSLMHTILGRKNRKCRINEWCCLLSVEVCKKMEKEYGIFFGNYEGGGDVATYWFEKIIREGYEFADPLPKVEDREKYYKHWWQGYEGHSVWVNDKNGNRQLYEKQLVINKLKEEFDYTL